MTENVSINSANLQYTVRKKIEIGEMFANNFGSYRNVECGLVHRRRHGVKRHPSSELGHQGDDDSSDSSSNSESDSSDDEGFVTRHHAFVPVPLTSVSVIASVVHAVAQVEITQVYKNKEDGPIEVIYFFPVDSNGAVTHFQAEFDGRIVKGVVKPNEEAKAQYEAAVAKNQTAFLGEENKPDIFKVSIGHLKPGMEVKVIIGYVTEVKNEPDTNSIRFFLPTTVAPRYTPECGSDKKSRDLATMPQSEYSPAPLSIKVIASVQGEISSIESPTHQITIEDKGLIPEKDNWHKWVIQLKGQTTEMDRDFLLMITPKEPLKPRLYSETIENGSTAVMVHFIPSFKLDEQKVELIFVMDRSGSMSGQSILMAQKALMLLIHSMPADCYFNVIGFGSTFESLFSKSRKYGDATLKEATKYAGVLAANMGGTEILSPLKSVYEMPPVQGYLRQIFVITDGEVSNTDMVIGLVKANAHKTRLFSLGIGNSASHYLVEGISQAGGGTCVFVGNDENIQKQALGQLKNALQPALTEIKIEWKGIEDSSRIPPVLNKEKTLVGYNKPIEITADSDSLFIQAPEKIPPVFDGSQLVVFGVFSKEKPAGAIITAESPAGPLVLDVEMSEENDVGSTKMLHRLAAIKIVRELELEEAEMGFSFAGLSKNNTKNKITEVAIQNGISSKYTSFVAVIDEDSEAEKKCWMMQTRHVPSQIPSQSPPYMRTMSASASSSRTYKLTARKCTGGIAPRRQLATMAARKSTSGVTPRPQTKVAKKSTSGVGPRPQTQTKAVRKCASISTRGCAPPQRSSAPPLSDEYNTDDVSAGGTGFNFGCNEPTDSVRVTRSSKRTRSTGSTSVVPVSLDILEPGVPMEIAELNSMENVHINQPAGSDAATRNITLHLVYSIINLQSFQGSFPLNPALSNIIGFDVNFLKAESLKNGWNETAWATALAIVFLSDNLMEWKDYWELVVTKAQKWMELNHLQSKDAMILAARGTINLRRNLCN